MLDYRAAANRYKINRRIHRILAIDGWYGLNAHVRIRVVPSGLSYLAAYDPSAVAGGRRDISS